MRQALRQVAIVLTRGLLQCCTWSRVDWRKLFFAGATMTILGILVPNIVFPNSPNIWSFSPPLAASSYISLNGSMHLRETINHARIGPETLNHARIDPETLNHARISPETLDHARIDPETLNHARIDPETPNNARIDPSVSVTPFLLLNSTVKSKEEGARISRKRGSVPRRRRKGKKINDEVKGIVHPPPRSPVLPRLQKYIWSLSPDDALRYAKAEIDHPPVVTDDPYLYAPIFRNFSVFKRSYELMEMILKVYIYPDGDKPIFHEPHLYGIYASEGWFMKFMESNKEFVTRDPDKAHLFYLPYSARQLQLAVYVPNSHNLRPLAIFMRDYVNMIAAKYPFWNHTHGKDHFIVACHDWGPYSLTRHEELMKNTIKVLCNADVSEGIFIPGKDVSLPETTIRNPKRPLRNVGGGVRVSRRPILAFFAGNMHGRVRPVLLQHWHNKDEDMKIYRLLPIGVSRNMSYVQHMKSSKYCICPMGYEVNSPRIVEAIYYECVPVIIADNFVLPFNEVLDWSAFSIVVAEKDIPKLKEILLGIPLRRYLTMLSNLKMVQKHFFWNPTPLRYDLFHMIIHSIWFSRVNQFQISES